MPEPISISGEEAKKKSPEELFAALASKPRGLSQAEAEARLAQYGPNALEEKRVNPFLKFLRYFWGPIPWMIEVAAGLSAVVRHWDDLAIILTLLVFNGVIGFWQEYKAANALEALKKQLALTARALRDGKWQEIPANALAPGDVIRISLGEIIPADVKLFEGDFLSVDQSALTGESLPVSKEVGADAYIHKPFEAEVLLSKMKGLSVKDTIDGIRIIRKGYQYLGVQIAAFFWYLFSKHDNFDLVVDQFHGIPFFTPLY